MSKKSFSKPALSLQDQLALLESRGLDIEDHILGNKQILDAYNKFCYNL